MIKGAICNAPLMINEAEQTSGNTYKFKGVFTQCSTPEHKVINRNNRIYTEKEMLKHIGYLRDKIKNDNGLLGELDHPEGRFDISLKEASHIITDLWYDQNEHCVMGALRILDTPNGKIAQELIEQGYPIFVSSRAAGDVNEKTREVEIAQIFTYDIVCTPGFAEARLERVNESLSPAAVRYLETCSKPSVGSLNESLGVDNKEVQIFETNVDAQVDKKILESINTPVNMADICKPINEEEENKEEKKEEKSTGLPEMNLNPFETGEKKEVKDESPEKKEKIDDKKDISEEGEEGASEEENKEEGSEDKKEGEEKSEEDASEKRKLILNIVAKDTDGNVVRSDNETEKSDDESNSKAEENREKIIDIKANDSEEKSEEGSEEKKEGEEKSEESSDNNFEEDVKEAEEKKNKVAEETKKELDELDALLNSVQKQEAVKESIIRRYPFAISLSESNFAKFASLRPEKKKKCLDFIVEHNIFDIKSINELWMTPLNEEKRQQSNWLKLASQSDIQLYLNASLQEQNAIEEQAKYVILETRADVDDFWAKTGLRQRAQKQKMTEQFIQDYKVNSQAFMNDKKANPLGYDRDYVLMVENALMSDSAFGAYYN